MNRAANKQGVFGLSIDQTAKRWEVSKYTVRRLLDGGYLASINVGARRFIPLAECERAEKEGVGIPRKRKQQLAESR